MIEINLLPLSLREKRRKMELPPTTFLLAGGGILALLLITYGTLTGLSQLKKRELGNEEEKFKSLKPESEKIAQLKDNKQKLEKKMDIIEQLVDKRILWARKFNELGNLIPPQVWLTSMFVEERALGTGSDEKETKKERFLIIKGVAISKGKGETGELKLVGDFMDEIRKDTSFCADVEQYGSIRRGKMGSSDTMYFELRCQFKEWR